MVDLSCLPALRTGGRVVAALLIERLENIFAN
jgi:hypothetical protein